MAIVYRPSHAAFTPVELGTLRENHAYKVILGDFNADQLGTSPDAIFIRSLLGDLSLQLVDHGVTR